MENLVEEAKQGNKEAYATLITEIKEELYQTAKSKLPEEDAKDAVQEAIIIGYLKINQLENNKNFKAWIKKILINECNKLYKEKKRQEKINSDFISKIQTEQIRNLNEDEVDFEKIILELDDIEQKIFTMYYKKGYSIKEIAQQLNIKENTIKSKLKRGREKIKNKYMKLFLMIITLGIVVNGFVFGKDIINYIKEIFNLSSIGQNNDGVISAIENKEWYQNVDMDYIILKDGYKIRIDYLLIDDINLYIVFELESEENLEKYDRLSVLDLKITDEDGNIICSEGSEEESVTKAIGWKNVESSNKNIQELVYMTSFGYGSYEELNINFSRVILYNDNNPGNISKTIETEEKEIQIKLEDKFINREIIEYTAENSTENYYVQKAIITDTGFYAIIESKYGSYKMDLIVGDDKYKCSESLLQMDENEEKYYNLIYANIEKENVEQLILDSNEGKIILNINDCENIL